MNEKKGLLKTLASSGEWVVPMAAVSMVFVMLVPLPSILLDLMLTVSITASVLVLLTAVQILRPVEFLGVSEPSSAADDASSFRSILRARDASCCMGTKVRRLRVKSSRRSGSLWSAVTMSSAS